MADLATLGLKVDSSQVAAAKRELGGLADSGKKAEASVMSLGKAFLAFAGGRAIASQAISMADGYTKLSAQLKIATNNAAEFSAAMRNVERISSIAQVDIDTVSKLYSRLALSAKDAGISQAQVAAISETVALGLKVNGASAAEASSAMLQLSQAFGSGVLRGEEFNSMMESAPNLMRALASSMDVPIGQLRTMAADGEITVDRLVTAFTDQTLKDALTDQAKDVQTISGAFVELGNQVMLATGVIAKETGATSAAASGVDWLTSRVRILRAEFEGGDWLDKLSAITGVTGMLSSLGVAPTERGKRVSEGTIARPGDGNLGASFGFLTGAALKEHNKEMERAAKAAKQVEDAARSYIESLQAEIDTLGMDTEQVKLYEAAKMAAANPRFAATINAQMAAYKTASKAVRELAAEEKARKDRIKAMDDETASIAQRNVAIAEEIAGIGKTAAEIELLQAARYDHETQIMRETLATKESAGACTAETEALREAIKAREKYKQSMGDLSAARALEKDGQDQVDMWKSIDQTAHDAFVNILSGGRDTATRLKDAFKAGFFDWLYQMTLKKWVFNVSGAAAGTGASGLASAAGTGGGGGGLPGFDLGGSVITALGNAIGSSMIAGVGTGMSIGVGAAAEAEAAYAAGGMAMEGAALTLGAAAPWIAGAIAIASLLGGSGGPTAQNLGTTSASFDSSGNMLTRTGGGAGGWMTPNATSDEFVAALQSQYSATIAALGGSAAGTSFFYGSGQQSDGTGALRRVAGGAGSSYFNSGELGADNAAVQLAASRAVFAALQGSELPGYLRHVFDDVVVGSMSQQQITDTLEFAQALKSIREQMSETRAPIDVARAAMADLGASLQTAAETYRTDFVEAIDAGLTPATLAKWQQFGALIQQTTQLEADRIDAINSSYDSAQRDLISAYQSEINAKQALMDRMSGYVTSLRGFRESLTLGSLSTLSPEAKLTEARRLFEDTQRRARLGDEQAIGDLQGVSEAFLTASRDYNASSEMYAADFTAVQDALQATESVAQRHADIAGAQLTTLRDQLDALGTVNTSVLSVADAIVALTAAMQAYGQAGLIRSTGGAVYDTASGNIHAANNQVFSAASAQSWVTSQLAAGDPMSVYNKARETGISLNSVNQLMGWSAGTAEEWARQNNLAVLDTGTDQVQRDGFAFLHRGEAVAPAASNDGTIDELRAQTVELRALVRQNGAGMQAMLDRLAGMEQQLAGLERSTTLMRASQ